MLQKLMGDYLFTAILVVCNLFVGAVVFIEWQYNQEFQSVLASHQNEAKPSTIEVEEIPTLNEILKPIGLYDEIVNRPLFIEGRQPIENVEDDDLLSNFSGKLSITLKGVVATPDGMIALFEGKDRKRYRLRMGDEVDGWEVAELQANKVILKRSGKQKELLLWIPKPKKGNKKGARPPSTLRDEN
jgi:type II secretory pathway component PulC